MSQNRPSPGRAIERFIECGEENVLAPVPHRQYVFTLPRVPAHLLAERFRRAVLDFLVENGAVSEEFCCRMLAWRHGGFSVHNEVSVAAEDAEGRKTLAGYMLPRPDVLAEDDLRRGASGTVIYRSKMHAGLKRNFQVMPGAEWLASLCKHIPGRYEHLVRYVGWYSNRARGERAKKASPQAGVALPSPGEAPANELAARARAAWARLIRKVSPSVVKTCDNAGPSPPPLSRVAGEGSLVMQMDCHPFA